MDKNKLGKMEFTVDGEVVTFDMDSDFDVEDINLGMSRVSAEIAFSGSVLSAAMHEQAMVEAHYRRFRAVRGKEIAAAQPKLALTKIDQEINSSGEFLTHKEAQANAARNVESLRWVVDAFRTKARILQSKGAIDRAALETAGMNTRERPFKTPAEDAAAKEVKTEIVRGAIQKTRAKA